MFDLCHCQLSWFGFEMDRWWPSRQILVCFFFNLHQKLKKNTPKWQSKVAGIFTSGRRDKTFTGIISRMLPLKWAELPLNTPLAPPSGKPINPAQGFRNINWETEYPKHKNLINCNSSIVALTTLHTAVPLFTQITSLHNTFTTNNNISMVRGHLTHLWRDPELPRFGPWTWDRPPPQQQVSVCVCICVYVA